MDDPDKTPPEGTIPDPPDTLVTCLACGGRWQIKSETPAGYRISTCAWCDHGAMSAAHIAKWSARKQGRPSR